MKMTVTDSKQTGLASVRLKEAFDLCVRKTRNNIKHLADEPKSAPWADDGNYFAHPEGFFEIGNWTSSFHTGMALMAWRETEEEYFLQQTLRLASAYREKAAVTARNGENPTNAARTVDMHHDAGFLYSLYSIALYKLTGDKQHRDTGLLAAEALFQRFNQPGGFIRAWGHLGTAEFENLAIIDCMMNLPLLYWASAESGDQKYHNVAVRQADCTLKNFIRADDSVFHAYRFDVATGQPIGGDNYCGFSADSHWARGTGWAIYGFAMSYRYTGDRRYRDAALRIARKFNQLLDGDDVPVWDFRLPAGQEPIRDTSAAAIVACGYQELEKLGAADALIIKTKESLLGHLCSGNYLNTDESCPGILKSAFGNRHAYSSWGDYYLMEALDRELHNNPTWW